jgi:hypothetical protein
LQPTVVPPAFTPPGEAEVNRLRQLAAEAQQYKPFVDSLTKYGIKDAAQLDSAFRPINAARERGLDLDQLVGALSPKPSNQQIPTANPQGPISMEDVQRFVGNQFAVQAHQSATAEQSRMESALVNEVVGSGGDQDKAIFSALVAQTINASRKFYPQDHPLHRDDLAPLSASEFSAVAAKVKEQWNGFVGSRIAALGNAPIRPQTAGAPGQPQPTTTATGMYVPFSKQPRETQLAAAQQYLQAMRPAAAPISAT